MAKFFTDFSNESVGTTVDNITDWQESDPGAWSVVSGSKYTGNRGVKTSNNSSAINYVGFNASDFEAVIRTFQVSSYGGTSASIDLRAPIVSGEGYRFNIHNQFGQSDEEVFFFDGSNFRNIARKDGDAPIVEGGNVFWLRYRINGNQLKAKAWDDGVSEPSSWDVTASDSSSLSGDVGFTAGDTASTQIDKIGIATNGDTAPKTEPVSIPSAPTNLSLSLQ
jgi:hypothetical protein